MNKTNDFSEENVDALANKYLAEVEAIETRAEEEAKAEAEAEEKAKAEAKAIAEAEAKAKADEEAYLKMAEEEAAAALKTMSDNTPDDVPESGMASEVVSEVEKDVVTEAASEVEEDVVTDIKKEAPDEDVLIDTNAMPFTLSAADSDGLAVTVLEKGTRLPARVRMSFSAPYKTPSAVKFQLYMGEALFAKDNILVDSIKLPGIKEYKDGITKIVLNLSVEKNGDIEIDLMDEGSVTKRHDKIELDFAECRVAIAEKPVSQTANDAELRDNYLVIQKARFTCAAAERYLKYHKREIDSGKRTEIKQKMKELKKAYQTADVGNLTAAQKAAMKNLMRDVF